MQDLKLAILIDADNISPKYVKVILDEAASFGVAACKRIYGDWSDVRLKSWKDALLNNSIIPIQQYSYTTGKNATDSAMIIDAMDLLYSGNLDGFCIVSSDSDFTRLAARLREAGKLVIGMGESMAQRLDLAFELAELGVDSVPMNILNPIPGTPLENTPLIREEEIIRTAATWRFILPDKSIRFAGGRMRLSHESMVRLLHGGINGVLMGDMLTTVSNDIASDRILFREADMIF